ncbi:hypothetical protein Tco_0200272 [Tanacetum coccineum]
MKLPQELSCVHDTFHVSNLKKCLAEPDVQVPLDEIEIDENLRFVEEPIEIVERDVKKLKRRRIPLVKVRWNSRQGAEYTWEHEDQFRMKYPHLFSEPVLSSIMSADSAVTYTFVHSEAQSWSIPSEDPYEEVARQLLEQSPTPPLPLSFLSPRIRPLHTRAPIRQMRAAAPSTYHSLLPLRTPPLLPIPLPAPSPSRRADIPEADTPPQKRLLLTTPRTHYGPTLEARITVLETEARRHEWQRQDADDHAVEHIMRTQALEARARMDTLEDTGSSS